VIDMAYGTGDDTRRSNTPGGVRRAELPRLVRPDGTAVRVLVIDDEPSLTDLLGMALRYEGWEVADAATGTAALRRIREFRPHVVVLDWMLPDAEGPDVLRRLREVSPGVPVLFLTAKDSVADRIAGLTAGGDDYVTKPSSLEELVARLRALLRRTSVTAVAAESVLRGGRSDAGRGQP